jgi:hypothetical protein
MVLISHYCGLLSREDYRFEYKYDDGFCPRLFISRQTSETEQIMDISSIVKTYSIKLIGAVLGALLFSSGILQYALEQYVLDMPFWIEYHAIVPAEESYKIGEKPRFMSDVTQQRKVDIEWSDTLRCSDDSGSLRYEDTHVDHAKNYTFADNSDWGFNGIVPTQIGTCWVDASVTITTRHGAKHSTSLQSSTFEYVHNPDLIVAEKLNYCDGVYLYNLYFGYETPEECLNKDTPFLNYVNSTAHKELPTY